MGVLFYATLNVAEMENPETAEHPEMENPEAENPEAEHPEAENPEAEHPEAEHHEAEHHEVEHLEMAVEGETVIPKVVGYGRQLVEVVADVAQFLSQKHQPSPPPNRLLLSN